MQQREHFTYRFEQLGPREATVFKSIVGLLDNRTHALWDHVERGETDLLVVDAHVLEHPDHLQFDARVILGIGMLEPHDSSRFLSLALPMRAGEVLARLEQAMLLLEVLPDAATPEPSANSAESPVRLLRWPSHALLKQCDAYLRLATLMGARATTAAQLASLSQLPLSLCQQFIALLIEQGQVAVLSTPAPVSVTGNVVDAPGQSRSLFARIRAHLGLDGGRMRTRH